MPIVFGHIVGVTVRLVVNTAKGNENSKANKEESDKVVLFWAHMVSWLILNSDIQI